ncbi:hypothetical protein AVEN_104229-1 [Araneus ventricosus]|uniref:Uncharacterized protein n=1 Tax=Araneus ventricosus TaxID=182803 RepID=A0A4Y2FGQ0_ARAVE|nr:hypothetical protein AVEN_104229-1 [Araneus ventricosus]
MFATCCVVGGLCFPLQDLVRLDWWTFRVHAAGCILVVCCCWWLQQMVVAGHGGYVVVVAVLMNVTVGCWRAGTRPGWRWWWHHWE